MSLNPPNRRRRPAGDGLALWRRTVRDVAPLRPRAPPPAKSSVEPPPPPRVASGPPLPAPSATYRPEPPLDSLAGIDRANAERLKRGRLEIEARLDLHGLTQSEAHRALAAFVASSQ